jgi:hypothetical protein
MTTAFDKEYYTKQAHAAIDRLVLVITTLEKEKAQLTFDFAVAKIEAIEPYVMPKTGQDFLRTDPYAQTKVDRLYEEDKAVRDRNLPRYESNRKLKEALTALMRGLGFPETTRGYSNTRSRKMITEPAGWVKTLDTIPIGDSGGGWGGIDGLYIHWCRIIKEAEAARQKAKADKEQQAAAEEKTLAKYRLLAELSVKYSPEFKEVCDTIFKEVGDAIQFLLGRDKYLRLAYYLEKNRGDWIDGPDYARQGIEGFSIDPEKPHDAEISKEIWGFIIDWDGDGRVFRDCKWDYGTLYTMANANLYLDLARLREHEEH